MLDPKNDAPDHEEALAVAAAKIATQGALLSGLDPIDHDRADVRHFRDRTSSVVSASVEDDAKG